jgi:hypothetical protein
VAAKNSANTGDIAILAIFTKTLPKFRVVLKTVVIVTMAALALILYLQFFAQETKAKYGRPLTPSWLFSK